MKREEFIIGEAFWCAGRQWRCTDVGTRTISAIRVDSVRIGSTATRSSLTIECEEAQREGWLKGPPYAVQEMVFDEYDIVGCTVERDERDAET